MERQQRFNRLRKAAAVCGVLALCLAGCDSGDSQPDAPTPADSGDSQPQVSQTNENATSAEPFVAAFEHEGLECAPADEDRWGPGVVGQVNCQGGNHQVIVTIRNFDDTDARDEQLARVQEQACTIAESGQETQRLATSGTWIVMVGGDREVDFEVFENAMTELDLDSEDYTC